MEYSGGGTDKKGKSGLFGGALLLAAAVSLVVLNLGDGYVLSWVRGVQAGASPLDLVLIYALAHGFAALSLLTAAALVLAPGAHRTLFSISAIFAAVSAFCSAAYAAGWWLAFPQSMVWQDYLCVALQALSCSLAVGAVAARRRFGAKTARRLLLLAAAGVAVSTLAFLLPPVAEPVYSVLTRMLSLGAPAVLLALGDAAAAQ